MTARTPIAAVTVLAGLALAGPAFAGDAHTGPGPDAQTGAAYTQPAPAHTAEATNAGPSTAVSVSPKDRIASAGRTGTDARGGYDPGVAVESTGTTDRSGDDAARDVSWVSGPGGR